MAAPIKVAKPKVKTADWGFRFFETVNPLKVGKEFASEPARFGNTDRASLGVDKDVYLTIPRGRMKDLKASYVLNTTELHAPLQKTSCRHHQLPVRWQNYRAAPAGSPAGNP